VNRPELVVVLVALFALAVAGIRLGWRNRGARQEALPELPKVPTDLGMPRAPDLTGLYVGTTVAVEWQNRIVVHSLGQRSDSVARLTEAGVLIERQGTRSIFIPATQLVDARLEPALAGKVVGKGGLLVLRWRLGEVELDTGLRADDRTLYPAWANAINFPRDANDNGSRTNQG
jgi:hypothetical protein